MGWILIAIILGGVATMALRVAYCQAQEIDQLKTLLRIANLKNLQAECLRQNQHASLELDKTLGLS